MEFTRLRATLAVTFCCLAVIFVMTPQVRYALTAQVTSSQSSNLKTAQCKICAEKCDRAGYACLVYSGRARCLPERYSSSSMYVECTEEEMKKIECTSDAQCDAGQFCSDKTKTCKFKSCSLCAGIECTTGRSCFGNETTQYAACAPSERAYSGYNKCVPGCTSSNDCGYGQTCSTENGVCNPDPTCTGENCADVCTGTCLDDCSPIKCEGGREIASCDKNGIRINYEKYKISPCDACLKCDETNCTDAKRPACYSRLTSSYAVCAKAGIDVSRSAYVNCGEDSGEDKCANNGEAIFANSKLGPTECCSKNAGIKPVSVADGDVCITPDNGSTGFCIENWFRTCGGENPPVCDKDTEDKCNCPADCGIEYKILSGEYEASSDTLTLKLNKTEGIRYSHRIDYRVFPGDAEKSRTGGSFAITNLQAVMKGFGASNFYDNNVNSYRAEFAVCPASPTVHGIVEGCGPIYSMVIPVICGNGVTDEGEECDDNNSSIGDGCGGLCNSENDILTTLDSSVHFRFLEQGEEVRCEYFDHTGCQLYYGSYEWDGANNQEFGALVTVTYHPKIITSTEFATLIPDKSVPERDFFAISSLNSMNYYMCGPKRFDTNRSRNFRTYMWYKGHRVYKVQFLNIPPSKDYAPLPSHVFPGVLPYDNSAFNDSLFQAYLLRSGSDVQHASDICGNSLIERYKAPIELCDDGNTVNGDGCSSTCSLEWCGNGIIDSEEECDDGNTDDGDGCSSSCTIEEAAVCGNAIKEEGEECDTNSLLHAVDFEAPFWEISRAEFERVRSYWEAGGYHPDSEEVDGYAAGLQGKISANAKRHTADFQEPFWQIDGTELNRILAYGRAGGYHPDSDGADGYAPGYNEDYSSRSYCSANCTLVSGEPVCGNGVVEEGETCDDGNAVDNDGCRNDCTNQDNCRYDDADGNNIGNVYESTTSTCYIKWDSFGFSRPGSKVYYENELIRTYGGSVCGDGVVDDGEECDDGNTVDRDGCSSACISECKDSDGGKDYYVKGTVVTPDGTPSDFCINAESAEEARANGGSNVLKSPVLFELYCSTVPNQHSYYEWEYIDCPNGCRDGVCLPDDGPHCGNGECEQEEGENWQNCPKDCDKPTCCMGDLGNDDGCYPHIDADFCKYNGGIMYDSLDICNSKCKKTSQDALGYCCVPDDPNYAQCRDRITKRECEALGGAISEFRNTGACATCGTQARTCYSNSDCVSPMVCSTEYGDCKPVPGCNPAQENCPTVCTGECVHSSAPRCGDGIVHQSEQCDDGNDKNGDGCTYNCKIEEQWMCEVGPSRCKQTGPSAVCGNGNIEEREHCDDGNKDSGDGCSVTCNVETGFACKERCTHANAITRFFRSITASIMSLFTADVVPPKPQRCISVCESICGDGLLVGDEQCEPPGTNTCDDECNVIGGGDICDQILGDDSVCVPKDKCPSYCEQQGMIVAEVSAVNHCRGTSDPSQCCLCKEDVVSTATLHITGKEIGTGDTAVENEADINLLRFEANGDKKHDLLLTSAAFMAAQGSLNNAQKYTLWVDTNNDGDVDTVLEQVSQLNNRVIFNNLVGGGYVIPDGQAVFFEVHADVSSSLSSSMIQLQFDTGDTNYIKAEYLEDGADLEGGIETNGNCNAAPCSIIVRTTDSQPWTLVSQGDLFVSRSITPMHSRQLLGGELGEPILRLKFRAQNEPIDVTDIQLTSIGNPTSNEVDRLELYKEGESSAFALATIGGCGSDDVPKIHNGNQVQTFCANMESRQLVVPEEGEVDILVRPKLKTDVQGAVSGENVQFFIHKGNVYSDATGKGAIRARGDVSSNNLSANDEDTTAEGEVFIGAISPMANEQITGMMNTSVMSKITSITNANPDPNGSAVPIGLSDIGKFKFTAANHNNSKNGKNKSIIDGIIFNVNATNVLLDASSGNFRVYNEADSTTTYNCKVYRNNSANEELTEEAEGSLLVECSNMYEAPIETTINPGESSVFVLQGNIINQNSSTVGAPSTLQVSLQQFESISYTTYGIDNQSYSHILWSDEDGGSSTVFTWIEYPTTVVKSTSYAG